MSPTDMAAILFSGFCTVWVHLINIAPVTGAIADVHTSSKINPELTKLCLHLYTILHHIWQRGEQISAYLHQYVLNKYKLF